MLKTFIQRCPKSFGIARYYPRLVKMAVLNQNFLVRKKPSLGIDIAPTNYAWMDSLNSLEERLDSLQAHLLFPWKQRPFISVLLAKKLHFATLKIECWFGTFPKS